MRARYFRLNQPESMICKCAGQCPRLFTWLRDIRFEVKNTAELESIRNKLLSIRDVTGSKRGQN